MPFHPNDQDLLVAIPGDEAGAIEAIHLIARAHGLAVATVARADVDACLPTAMTEDRWGELSESEAWEAGADAFVDRAGFVASVLDTVGRQVP